MSGPFPGPVAAGRVACLLAFALASAASAQEAPSAVEADEEPWLSPRNASYTIDVRLDPAARTLEATQQVRWVNLQESATNRLWFHLYWNAWRNRHSTWMREERLSGRLERRRAYLDVDDIDRDDWGYTDVESVVLADGTDITRTIYFAFPDDENVDDRTVMVVLLPESVGPGESVELTLRWRSRIPRTFARTGFRGDYYFIAHWFPALGVFGPAGWQCHQFHAGTEFFSDYGVYDVSMTVPDDYVLGATGRLVERRDNGDGTATHRYAQADVHTFSWTASADFIVAEERFEHDTLPPVDIRLLLQPDHYEQADRHFAATRAALEHYGTWYGAYPYGHLTVVDPAYGSNSGGMEYPTLFTSGTRLVNPEGGGRPEGVTIHEAGHQFWYGIVGNDEFEHAWLDEGLNTFSTLRTQRLAFGESVRTERFFTPPGAAHRDFFALLLPGFDYGGQPHLARVGRYRPDATSDAQRTPSYRYHPRKGGSLSYSKTALWLVTLENWLGWETLREILSTFFERWRFAHPTAEDFFAVADELTDRDLEGFFRDVMGSGTYDYSVQSVATFPAANEGWVKRGDEMIYVEREAAPKSEDAMYRSEVIVERRGDLAFPVEVLMVFADGHEVRHRWDGRRRWKLFVEEHTARLDHAIVDPDGILALDLFPSNNSRLVEPRSSLPAWKWAARWTVWLQDFMATFGVFV